MLELSERQRAVLLAIHQHTTGYEDPQVRARYADVLVAEVIPLRDLGLVEPDRRPSMFVLSGAGLEALGVETQEERLLRQHEELVIARRRLSAAAAFISYVIENCDETRLTVEGVIEALEARLTMPAHERPLVESLQERAACWRQEADWHEARANRAEGELLEARQRIVELENALRAERGMSLDELVIDGVITEATAAEASA